MAHQLRPDERRLIARSQRPGDVEAARQLNIAHQRTCTLGRKLDTYM